MGLDDFKHINDGLGHQYGDILLKAYADRAATAVYQLDAVFDVLDASGKKAGSITTDPATGEGYLSDLDPGTYTIKEVKAPKYATLSTASWNLSKRDCFHAYDSSGKSAQSELARTLY